MSDSFHAGGMHASPAGQHVLDPCQHRLLVDHDKAADQYVSNLLCDFDGSLESLKAGDSSRRRHLRARVRKSKVASVMGRLSLLAFGLSVCLWGPLVCSAQVI